MKYQQIQSVTKEVQSDYLGNGLTSNAFSRASQAVEELGDGLDVQELVRFFKDEQTESLRQADYYENHLRFYHENVAAARRAEAEVFGVLVAALIG